MKIFILGAPRSGTTLLLGMLVAGQKQMGGLPFCESQFYTNACRKKYEISTYLEDKYFNQLLTEQEIVQIFNQSHNHVEFFNNCINHYLGTRNKKIFVEKSPVHTLFYKQIVLDFVNVRFIVIKRNVYANIQSIFATRWIPLITDKIPHNKTRRLLGYFAAMFIYYKYNIAVINVEKSSRCILSINYEDMFDKGIVSVLEDKLGVKFETLYIPEPDSSVVTHGMNILDHSRIEGYRDEMPIYMQKLIQKIFEPSSNLDKIISVAVRCCMYPIMRINLFLQYRVTHRYD